MVESGKILWEGKSMTEKERMLSGKLYIAKDGELERDFMRARKLTRLINATTEEQLTQRQQLFGELVGSVGENCWIEAPFRCDYGSHIHIGDNFYANYDCIMLDVCDIYIGDNVLFGPRVSIYTAAHPIDTGVRSRGLEYGKMVRIGSNVWVGGNAVINPGVTIGDNVVIGSGSVVTRDIPSGVVAAGAPCRVLREITEEDRAFWEQQAAEYDREEDELT